MERCLSGVFTSGEDHSCYPEENDVVTGNKDIGGIEILQILSVFRPAKGFERPQGGTEPGVQHIRIPINLCTAALFTLTGILTGDSDVTAVGTSPRRDLMSPPQLTGNAPIPDIFHPVKICLAESVGDELGFPVLNHTDSFLCQRLHFYKPLGRNDRLHIIVAAIAGSHIVGVILHTDKIALFLEVGNDCFSCIVAVHSLVLAAVGVHNAVVVKNPDHLKIVTQAHLKVVGVMGRSHLNAAGTKVHFCIIIGNHRDLLVHQRQNHGLTDDVCIAGIIGVDAHTGITQHGFGSCGGNNHLSGTVRQGVADVPQMTGLVHILHFGI